MMCCNTTVNIFFALFCIVTCLANPIISESHIDVTDREFRLHSDHSYGHVDVEGIPNFKTGYFSQVVDHFNNQLFSKPSSFKQRYLYTDLFWKKPYGPIFFYTGNEGPIDAFWNNTGFMFDIAPKFGALIIFAEHRYYGKTLPFGNKSFTSQNLRYLTIEQALADFAVLLTNLKEKVFMIPNNPVISFGGSYGGMLTAYMRFKYPNIIDGGVVGSAPIYWIANLTKTHPVTFFDDVTKDFADINSVCVRKVKSAFSQILQLYNSGDQGKKKIATTFNLCSPLRNATDLRQVFGWSRNAFVLLAMLDYPYPTNFMVPLPGWPVKAACTKMLNISDDLLALKAAVEVVYPPPSGCHDIYKEYIYCADPTGCGVGSDATAWDYQACTQMALPSGSNNVTDMFPPLAFTPAQLTQYCKEKYDVVPNVDWFRINFWGDKISTATNLVFSNGDLDPWHRGGVLANLTDRLTAVRIKDGAHHLDLRSSNPLDPASVKQARLVEEQYVAKWIKEAWLQRLHHFYEERSFLTLKDDDVNLFEL